MILRLPREIALVAAGVGVAAGLTYVLSPLTVWSTFAFAAVVWWAGADLPDDERRRVRFVLVVAILVRLIAIAGLFVTTNHAHEPFGSFFGDEEYFIRRSLWLRNVALGIPIHSADLIYAFDEYSYTHYLYVMGFLQALAGFAPYGLHVVSAAMYVGGAAVLFRVSRRAFGPGVGLAGLLVVLFLPSLFAWSIAALKEPPYFLVGALACAMTVTAVRTPSPWRRVAAIAFVVGAAFCQQAVRDGGLIIAALGLGGGVAIAVLATRPRVAFACAVAIPIVVGGLLTRPSVQLIATQAVRRAARLHWGHVNTPGYSYKTLDDRLYPDRSGIDDMSRGEVWRFLVRSGYEYATGPRPWTIESRAALAFVPELMFWYALLALAPFGFVAGLRRDPLVTGLLAASAVAAAALVAVTSGNTGTLIRHRGLALPYVVWLSAMGGNWLLQRDRA